MTRQPAEPTPGKALLGLLTALAGAALACTLSFNDSGDPATNAGGPNSGGGGGAAPSVSILEPVSGQQVPSSQAIDITVQTTSTATSFLLSVDNRVVSSKALPPGQSGPTTAILSWTPPREGSYTLEVVAFNGAATSAPASVQLNVSGAAAVAPGGTVSGCTARVLVSSLNFRDGPGTGYTRLGQFDVGETVTVIGRNGDSSWFQVQRQNAQQAWVINNAQWLVAEGQCSAVPVTG